ncbi:MAG: Acidobacterial duplicated orphan permease (function unknown) [uncultured Cytophagales bacterium]|uniref:ABC transporter, fused permease protein n=1 Tax=uncultured Cytophagales bacterium TaxID=158755 RepID=A0A6J4LT46_9SPHI|nr:MAG: Acidobacterial duplicated orphan permease (function unknown) [uncultured Cytophagales bacterium]
MLSNYLIVAFRNLARKRAFSCINIMGLALGMAACLLIMHYVVYELSFDNFHQRGEHVYGLVQRSREEGKEKIDSHNGHPAGPLMQEAYGEVQHYARTVWARGVVTYLRGADVQPQPITFRLAGHPDADTVKVGGTFNGWQEHLLQKTASGWTGTVHLPPGEYAYKFLVDGQVVLDPANPLVEQDREHVHSLRKVSPRRDPSRAVSEVSSGDNKTLYADASFLTLFSFPLVKGDARTALAEINTAVVTESAARRYFGNEEPLGKRIIFNGVEYYVITGVVRDVPANSHVQFDFLFSMKNALAQRMYRHDPWHAENFNVYLQLEPGASPAALEAKLPAFVEKHRGDDLRKAGRTVTFALLPLRDLHLKTEFGHGTTAQGDAMQVYFLMLIAGFILVIAWVNYINLSTARATERAREVGIRKVAGAHRPQLIRQFLFESGLVNALAAGVAVLLVSVSLPEFAKLIGRELGLHTLLQEPALLLAFAAAFVAGTFLSGLYPAFVLSTFRPVAVLKGNPGHSPRGVGLRQGLVVFQFAASILLIAGTLVVYAQLEYMRNQKLGFNTGQTLVVDVPAVKGMSYGQKSQRLKSRLLSYAAVKQVTISSNVPGTSYSWNTSGIRRKEAAPESGIGGSLFWADADFLPAYGIKLVAGRNFSRAFPTDREGTILNEKAARLLGFSNPAAALGKPVVIDGSTVYVVGVMQNYHHNSLKSDHTAAFLLLSEHNSWGYYSLMLRGGDVRRTVADVEREYRQVFPGNPFKYVFLDESFNAQYRSDRQFGQVFSLFASLAILVACLGLFGLASFTAAQRTREIGVRKVMGASVGQIVQLLYRDFVKLVLLANAVALPLAYLGLRKWLQNYPFSTTLQWWMLAVPGLAVLLVALLTVSFQSIRAALANPARSLRSE